MTSFRFYFLSSLLSAFVGLVLLSSTQTNAFQSPAAALSDDKATGAVPGKQAKDDVLIPFNTDYSKLAFFPDRWTKDNVSFEMIAWEGRRVVFLTKPGDYDSKIMSKFVARLDQGWQVYEDLLPKKPGSYRQIKGKTTICALPKDNLSCGIGCGYVGVTGVEVAKFYNDDWPAFQKNQDVFAHYYFYEMGRNYFIFGDRHSVFTTGYAVFMRYVCMDEIGCNDDDLGTRRTIESCEQIYADSNIPFLEAFTNVSSGEKGNRLRGKDGQSVSPSDQPVMYATAMLKLRKDFGGNEWLKKFYAALETCQNFEAKDEAGAIKQCFNWLVCASIAAGQDLAPVFADRWRMPLTQKQRSFLKEHDWKSTDQSAPKLVNQLIAID